MLQAIRTQFYHKSVKQRFDMGIVHTQTNLLIFGPNVAKKPKSD